MPTAKRHKFVDDVIASVEMALLSIPSRPYEEGGTVVLMMMMIHDWFALGTRPCMSVEGPAKTISESRFWPSKARKIILLGVDGELVVIVRSYYPFACVLRH